MPGAANESAFPGPGTSPHQTTSEGLEPTHLSEWPSSEGGVAQRGRGAERPWRAGANLGGACVSQPHLPSLAPRVRGAAQSEVPSASLLLDVCRHNFARVCGGHSPRQVTTKCGHLRVHREHHQDLVCDAWGLCEGLDGPPPE
jgi:hypothetical protein